MAISREQFEIIREDLGAHTSWAVWAPEGKTPKSNVGDLSIFNDEDKIKNTLQKLNPDIILVGLNGSSGEASNEVGLTPFRNFHSSWFRATDYKIRYATRGSILEGAFMTDVIKHHHETDSSKVKLSLTSNPDYERSKVEEFFREIASISAKPTIFAFGDMAYSLIQKYNRLNLPVHKLYHYAYTMSKETYRAETLKTVEKAGL